MTHRVIYLRQDRTLPGLRRQLQAIEKAGVDLALAPAFTGGALQVSGGLLDPSCQQAVAACSPGGEFWVAAETVLGSAAEAVSLMAALGDRGAALRVAASGQRYAWHPAAADLAALVLATAKPDKAVENGKMSAAALAREAKHREENADAWAEARRMWKDCSNSGLAIELKTGIKRRSLYHAVERGDLPRRPRRKQVTSLG